MIAAADGSLLLLTSLMPSSRTTYRNARLLRTSRSRRRRALTPLAALSDSTLLPEIPSLTTENAGPSGCASIRSDRTSGHRRFWLPLDPDPSVIESPRATTVPGALADSVLTDSRKYQWLSV